MVKVWPKLLFENKVPYLQSKVAFRKAASSFAGRLFVHRDVRADRLCSCSSRIEDIVEVLDRLRTLRLAGLFDHAHELRIAEPLAHVETVRRADEKAALIAEAGAHATTVGLHVGRVFVHFGFVCWGSVACRIGLDWSRTEVGLKLDWSWKLFWNRCKRWLLWWSETLAGSEITGLFEIDYGSCVLPPLVKSRANGGTRAPCRGWRSVQLFNYSDQFEAKFEAKFEIATYWENAETIGSGRRPFKLPEKTFLSSAETANCKLLFFRTFVLLLKMVRWECLSRVHWWRQSSCNLPFILLAAAVVWWWWCWGADLRRTHSATSHTRCTEVKCLKSLCGLTSWL